MLEIKKLSMNDFGKYQAMIKEWKESQTSFVPDFLESPCQSKEDFQEIINRIKKAEYGIHEDTNYFGKCHYYVVFNEKENLVGAVVLRENMTDLGRNTLGNIAIGIRPSCRKKGYATVLLKVLIEKAKEMSMNEITICHYSENKISEQLLLSYGAKFDGSVVSKVSGKEIKRYRINL